MKKVLLTLGLAAIASSVHVNAVTILGITDSTGSVSFQEHQYLAQQFAFTGTVELDSINLYFQSTVGGTFTASVMITDGLGAGVNTLFSTTAQVSDGQVAIPAVVSLNPGAYFIVLSTTSDFPANSSWVTTGTTFSEPLGAIGSTFFSQSQNVANPEQSLFAELPFDGFGLLKFDLDGEFSGVHDPIAARALIGVTNVPDSNSSGLLFAIGCCCVAAFNARRSSVI